MPNCMYTGELTCLQALYYKLQLDFPITKPDRFTHPCV